MRYLTFMLAAFFFTGLCLQADADDLKERFAERLPKINELKEEQKIGEDNNGYLQARAELSRDEKKLVDAENADRKAVYKSISEKTGKSVEYVEKRRAAMIAEKSVKGIWLQKADGTWIKKK